MRPLMLLLLLSMPTSGQIVRISTLDPIGDKSNVSGVAVSDRLVLTSLHHQVGAGNPAMTVHTRSKDLQARVIVFDYAHDLCVVLVKGQMARWWPVATSREDGKLHMAGYTLGDAGSFQGTIFGTEVREHVGESWYLVSGQAKPGMSGGPLFKNRQIYGVIVRTRVIDSRPETQRTVVVGLENVKRVINAAQKKVAAQKRVSQGL